MPINVKRSQTWKYDAGKLWSMGLGMIILLAAFVTGCGSNSLPAVTSLSSSSGTQGQVVNVTLTGRNFKPGSTISLSGTGITVSNLVVASSTSITATFTIAASAAVGSQNVTVTSSGLTSGPQPFTVTLLAITVSSTSPANGATAVPINEKI